MKQKVFILGERSDQPRHYSMTFLPPMDGMRLSLKVAKLLADMPVDALNLEDSTQSSDILYAILNLIKKIDTDELMGILEKVIEKTSLYAEIKGSKKSVSLNNRGQFNTWFEEYPQDLLLFAKELIWRNVSPFLPVETLASSNLGPANT